MKVTSVLMMEPLISSRRDDKIIAIIWFSSHKFNISNADWFHIPAIPSAL